MKRALLVFLGGCATLADAGGGDEGQPNAMAGPFRDIRREELGNGRVAPYALRDDNSFVRDACVVDEDDDPTTLAVVAFAAARRLGEARPPASERNTNQILRYTAKDGRSFDRSPSVVLEANEPWQGGVVGSPSVVRFGGNWLMFYGAEGGIGLATSSDGSHFSAGTGGPLLARATGTWDDGDVPMSPGAIVLPDQTLRLFYATTAGIGEAKSEDGVSFTRAPEPVLSAASEGYDAGGVGAPHAVLAQSPLGRDLVWLYYAASDADGRATIGAAARTAMDGPFVRSVSPVFGTASSLGPGEPCVVRFTGFSLLFVTERAGVTSAQNYPAVAVGVAPAAALLPAPNPE